MKTGWLSAWPDRENSSFSCNIDRLVFAFSGLEAKSFWLRSTGLPWLRYYPGISKRPLSPSSTLPKNKATPVPGAQGRRSRGHSNQASPGGVKCFLASGR